VSGGELDDAYERLHRMGPEYEGDARGNNGLTNHGPMAAEVLARRGYGDRIGRWVDGYLPRLVELAPSLAAVWSASAAIVSAYEPARPLPRADLPAAPRGDDPVPTIVERATDHGDEHVMKFTDTAVEVYERTGDPDALAAARHIIDLTRR
jgi:hypothetical protein